MKPVLKFTPIELSIYERGKTFWYFSKAAPTGYSVTVDIDVTHMLAVLKASGKKFFPAYLWLATKIFCEQKEFCLAMQGKILGFYNTLTPMYAVFHEDDKTFSLLWTEFDDNFSEFYSAYMSDKAAFGNSHGILAKKEPLPPQNAYTISCVPWISFKHFSVHSYENKEYYFPSVESGKFYKTAKRPLCPSPSPATTPQRTVGIFQGSLKSSPPKQTSLKNTFKHLSALYLEHEMFFSCSFLFSKRY